jgi:hypothetical protein
MTNQRERHRRNDRAAHALHCSSGDQHALRRGEAADEARRRECGRADQEQPTMPEQIAETAREQQKAAEREHIGVHHPGE